MASITDKPIAKLEQDSLNIQKYASSLSKFIRNSDTPITIGLQGEWGTGKTSLMSLLLENFNEDGKDREIATSWVNTWEYSLFKGASETTPAVLSGMLEKLRDENSDIWTIKDVAADKVKKATKFLSGLANQVIEKQTGMNVKEANKNAKTEKNVAHIVEVKNLIASIINELIEHSKNKIQKVVFFVDDLDRIPPTDAVEVLESLKNIFDIPKCVFILAIDYDVVVKGLESKFGKKTKENEREFRSFFDKIIQVPFTMPVGAYDITTFLKTKLNDLGVEQVFIEASIGQITKIVRYTIGNNPRSLKRYLNTFSLINQIMDDDEDSEKDDNNIILLFAVLGIQVSYPQIFRLLTQNPDYLGWNEKFGNKIGLDLSKTKENIENVGENELTDETWEQIIWGFCQEDPYLKVKCFNILELFNFLRELSCKNDLNEEWNEKIKEDVTKYDELKEKLYERLSSVLEFAAITNVDDDIEVKSITTKGNVVYFDGFDGWIQEMRNGQEKNKQLGVVGRKAIELSSEMVDCLKYWCDYFQSEGHDLTYTPGGGCTVKHKKIKFINLEIKKSKIAFNILRASERDYYRPLIDGLESSNIRRYAPLEGQFTPLYKEFFKLIGDIKVFESKKSELKSIFKEAVETIDDDNKLKVDKGNHHILEDIFNGTYNA
jgi:Cdc6-like AAA superfamily ATPase|tara:strand:- start:2017 stop:3999 length:1983 start_codon:yes stop_codon:yes gene_type:complete